MAETRPQPNEDIVMVGKKIAQNIPCLKTGIDYYFNFIIEKDGSFSNVNLVRGELDTTIVNCYESIQTAFANSPKWIPGKNGNIPVRIQFMMIIKKEIIEEINGSNLDSVNSDVSSEKRSEWNQFDDNGITENSIIDTTKIGSYIRYFAISNKANGKWVTSRKGRWSDFFNYSVDYNSWERLNWKEWYEKSKSNVVESGSAAYEYIGHLKDNKPNGDWVIKHRSLTAKGSFINGKPNGEWIYYKKKSAKKGVNNLEYIVLKENYINGIPNGDWFTFNEEFEDNPILELKESFNNGKPNGEIIRYHNSKVFTKTNFLDGLPNGESYMYGLNDSGKSVISLKAIYKLGKPISYIYGKNSEFKVDFLENSDVVRKSKNINGIYNKLFEISRNSNEFELFGNQIDTFTAGIWRVYMILIR